MKIQKTMHIDFDPLKVQWTTISEPGAGGVQFGGYGIFRGQPYQRGAGLGSVFRSVWRYLLPIGKEIGMAIGRQGMESGNRVLSNVLEGGDLKKSLANEGKAGLKNLLEKAASRLDAQSGKGFDFKPYKNMGKIKNIHKLASSVGPPNFLPTSSLKSKKKNKQFKKKKQQRLRIDALGAY